MDVSHTLEIAIHVLNQIKTIAIVSHCRYLRDFLSNKLKIDLGCVLASEKNLQETEFDFVGQVTVLLIDFM